MALDTEAVKSGVDVLAVSTTASALMGWLPPLAALATLIWTCIRIYETQDGLNRDILLKQVYNHQHYLLFYMLGCDI